MYKKVLVPLDGSALAEGALGDLKEIAKAFKPEVVLLSVATSVLPPFYGSQIPGADQKIYEKAEADYEAWLKSYLEKVMERLQKDGVSASSVVLKGKAAESIIDYAKKNGVDLIIMTTHGHSERAPWVLGSVADKVVRLSTVAVMLIPSEKDSE